MKYKKILVVIVAIVIVIEGAFFVKTHLNKTATVNNDKADTTTAMKQEVENEKKEESTNNDTKEQSITNDSQNEKSHKNKIIVIDPGHGKGSNLEKEQISPESSEMKIKDGGGTEGKVTGTPEYVVNMKVALKLKKDLEERGFTVILTKEEINMSLGNIERAEVGNKANASLVIRIHADGVDNSSAKGASMLVPALMNKNTKDIYNDSNRYGQVILDTLTSEVGMKNRGVVQRDDMTGFNWSTVPVVLVEMGFLSNPEEDKLLNTEEYQYKISKALADGINSALN